ncbi:MAG: hypothetical protein KY445_14495, partial [Armatimonadetes bacterium]|nr:hypothetical protein [Armatimonadota bacterium]
CENSTNQTRASPDKEPLPKHASGARLTHTPNYHFSGLSCECPHCFTNNVLPYFNNPNMVFQCYSCKLHFDVLGLKPSSRSTRRHGRPSNWFDNAMAILLILGIGVPFLFLVGAVVGLIPYLILFVIFGSAVEPIAGIMVFGCGFGAVAWFLKSCIEDKIFW